MVLYVLFGVLAAFGLACAMWAALGLWLSGASGWVAVCFDPAAIRRCSWLRAWGFLRGPIWAVADCFTRQEQEKILRIYPEVELRDLEELASGLEQERNDFAGTGNGDHSGNHRCGGLSEL